ncbi:helix-turn-helix domain-containing protein [Glycomyces sp. NPDC047010]|uniref:TetR/AcrR family transcriptional regulator n=1 Tax=Glycomyces sp. NPDC047010 TaxID=3155023 RepID=UPI0033F8B90F
MPDARRPRRDARDNEAKLRAAALEIFEDKGLDASLESIAKAAGVSIGTLYNRFGSREGLIDAVIPDIAGARLQTLGAEVLAQPDPKARLETFVRGMIALQRQDPALNDAILRRYPDATALIGICDASTALGQDLIAQAHDAGVLAPEFTQADLFHLLWLAGIASREAHAPNGWQHTLTRALDNAWT